MKTISTFVIAILVFGFLFLALPEKGYSQPDTACCIDPVSGCKEFAVNGAVRCELNTFITGGICTELGLGGQCVSPVSSVPTLSEWGLISLAGTLGVIGFIMVIRKRKATA